MTRDKTLRNVRNGKARRPRLFLACVMLMAVGVPACDMLLDVEARGRVGFETLADPRNADLLVHSARAAFECAFGSYIVAGGLLGNEFNDSQLAAALWNYNRRTWDPSGGQYATGTCGGGTVNGHGVLTPLLTGVFMGDTAVTILENFSDAAVPNRAELIATAAAYAGYSTLLVGEAMCEAAIRVGPALDSNQLFTEAEDRFTRALSGSPSAEIRNMALVGRARARLNRGNTAGALADAITVPPGFRRDAAYASTGMRESNRVERSNRFGRWVSVEAGFQDLSVEADGTLSQGGAIPDPRVSTTNTGELAADQTTTHWIQNKYTARDQAIPIARYEEAQLIIAEIELGQTAVDIVNSLHAAAGLPAWTPNDVNDDVEVLNQVIGERMRELYLESQHYFSLRRYHAVAMAMGVTPEELNPLVPYFPAAGVPFKHGGVHGDQPCLPLPDAERLNNPNIP